MTLTLRQAGLDDLGQLVPLFDAYRGFYGQPSEPAVSSGFLRQRIEQDQSFILLALNAAGEGVGFTQLFPSFSSVRAAPIFILNDLFVTPQARGQGAGAALLREAARWARGRGAVQLVLSTARDNQVAQRLYAAEGWVRDEEFFEYGLTL